jgi:hypothetical protein
MQSNVLGLFPRLIMLDWTVRLDALVGLEAVGLYEIEFGKHFYEREEIKCISIL